MIRILSIAAPVSVYVTLVILAWGLWRERRKMQRLALIPALAGMIGSFAFLAPVHRLFFDEDTYISIASNLTRAPVAQVTILGGPDIAAISSYFKQPAGWPVLLSLVFLITGGSETVAFFFARILFAATIAAVYQLAHEALQERRQSLTAAFVFAATPVSFWFSVSAGNDIPAALFATIGLWGCAAGNGPLAAAGLVLAAQTRMELIVLLPILWLTRKITVKWKAASVILVAAEIAHLIWVMSIEPTLAAAERVPAAFSLAYLSENFPRNVEYLLDPLRFPAAMTVLAAVAIWFRPSLYKLGLHFAGMWSVYLFFYAGSFVMNPRYSLQIVAPLAVLGASVLKRPLLIAAFALSVALPYVQATEFADYARALVEDHRLSVRFASTRGPDDLVMSTAPEVFLNQGLWAMNASFAQGNEAALEEEFRRRHAWYHAGVTTNTIDSYDWRVDQWVKSNFDLRAVESHDVNGSTVTFYEIHRR